MCNSFVATKERNLIKYSFYVQSFHYFIQNPALITTWTCQILKSFTKNIGKAHVPHL